MKQRKWDAILIAAIALIATLMWLVVRPSGEGAFALVTLHGEVVARCPLSEDTSITIGDEEYNILTIRDGSAFISDANCGDHTCIHTGAISLSGQQIICLPHEMIVEIIGGDESPLDAATH